MGPGRHANSFLQDQEEENSDSAPENAPDSPSNGDEARTAPATPPPKKRKGLQKRVISVLITGGDDKQQGDGGSDKIKGEGSSSSTSFAPSDSWAWRKYGQKPIKGSPYPRGYYRCSTSKGCPARKQVERSRLNPAMLVVTYSSDHNHPLPYPKHLHHHHYHHQQLDVTKSEPEDSTSASAPASVSEFVAADIGEDSLIKDPDFHWLAEAASATSYPLRPIYAGSDSAAVVESTFSMGEEDESLFGDLGELPEYSLVFRNGNPVGPEEKSRRCGMSAVTCVGPAA